MSERDQSAGARFLERVSEVFDLEVAGPAELLVLDQLVALVDQVEQLDQAVAAEGTIIRGGNGQSVAHPALAAARQHRIAIARLADQVGLGGVETPGVRQARHAAAARWRGGHG